MTVAPNGRTAAGRLAGRIALITGASRGLGAAAALAYAMDEAEKAHATMRGKSKTVLVFDFG